MLGSEKVRKQQLDAVARRFADMGPDAVDPLCVALQDSRVPVRQVAARALCHLRDERALDPILNLLYSDDGPCVGTLYHHGVVLGIPGVKDALLKLVRGGGSESQRYLATCALSYAKDDEIVACSTATLL